MKLPDLEAAGDSAPGSIVELRRFDDRRGIGRVALAVRSDLPIEAQITAPGATWLDRQAISRSPEALGGGFGTEVRDAMEQRATHLVGQRLAQRHGETVIFRRNLIETLRDREVVAAGEALAARTRMQHQPAKAGEFVTGTYRERLSLASGRFAMIDNGLGFQLVPWTPSLDRHLGQHVSGVARSDGGVDWSFARTRTLGR